MHSNNLVQFVIENMKHILTLDWCLFFYIYTIVEALDNKSLVAVTLIFRHGNRNPELNNLYATIPYYNESYFKPNGLGQLTNKGKLTSYNLGKEIRTRYTGFLDEAYNIRLIDARSSDFNRTKQSLQAFLAGLFPPTKELIWLPGFNWQPIATNYAERNSDSEFFFFGCPKWDPNIEDYLSTNEGVTKFKKHEPLLQLLTEKTGEDYNILKAYYLFFGFQILGELNYTLPDWASKVYPQPLENLVFDYYDMMVASKNLRQMSGGYLLKHILQDTQEKIDGKYPNKKMYLWSGHESNLTPLLRILKVWNNDIVNYGSYIAMELHYVDNVYGFQILYKNNASGPVILKLPDCDLFCPLETFRSLVQSDIPADESVCRRVSSSGQLKNALEKHIILIFSFIIFCQYKFVIGLNI